MSTQLWLRSIASDLNTSGALALWPVRGPLSQPIVTATVASGTNIQATYSSGGTAVAFYSLPLTGVTISGNITVNIRALESSASANACVGIQIDRVDSSGTFISTIVANQAVTGTELGTTDGATSGSATLTPTSTTLATGDRIKVTLFVKAATSLTMGGPFTVSFDLDGPTSPGSGDTFVTFTETLTSSAPTASAYIAAEGATGAATSTLVLPVAQDVQPGTVIVVCAESSAGAVTGITDSQSNTYTFRKSDTSNQNDYQYTCVVATKLSGVTSGGSDTITITRSGTSGQILGAAVAEPRATGTIDTTASKSGHGASGTNPTLASGTLAQAAETLVAMISSGSAGGQPAWTASSGFDTAGVGKGWACELGASGGFRFSMSFLTVNSTSAVTASATLVGSATWGELITCVEISTSSDATATPSVVPVVANIPSAIPGPVFTNMLANAATGAATNATASWTPSTTAQYLLGITAYVSTGSVAPSITSVAGNGITWTLIATINPDNTGADQSTIWVYAASGSGGSAGAITITWNVVPTKASWALDQVVGADSGLASGTLAQSAATNTSSGANPSATLGSGLKSGSATWAAAGFESTSGTLTPGSGYTALSNVTTQSNAYILTEWDSVGSTTAEADNSVTTNRHGIILLEIAKPITNSNATATPSVVACAASIGSATVNTGEKVTPAVVSCTATIGSPAIGPIALRACQAVTTGGGSPTLAVPAQPCAVGDLIFIWAVAGFASLTFTADAGDSLTAETANSSSSPAGSSQLFHKIADSSDVAKAAASGSYTITISTSHTWDAVVGVVPVTSTAHPFDPSDTPGSGQANASSNNVTAAGITTASDGDLLVWLGSNRISAGGVPPAMTVPSGYTAACPQANSSGSGTVNSGLLAATAIQQTHGATGSVVGTYTGTAAISMGLALAIKAAPIVALAGTVSHMVAGAPSPSGFGVITKLNGATSVRLAYSTSPSMTSPSYVSAQTPDGNGYVTHQVTGLSASTVYYVQAADTPSGGGEVLVGPIGSCKTLPTAGSPASFTVALAACIAEQDVTSPAQDTAINDLVAWAPDLTIFTGDLDYSGSTSTSTDTQRGVYETQIATLPGLADMVSQTWGYYCRSDHEAGPDNGDSDNAYTAANLAAAQQVFPFGTLGDTVNTPVHGLYQAWVVGRVRFIMVDIRNTDRSPGANTDNGSKTMLGATQLAWLESQLTQSEPLKVIISDVAWMGAATTSNGPDKWWSYDTERQAILSYIAAHQAQVQNVMLWHGDSHLVGVATPAKNTWGNFPVYCAAPLLNVGGGLNTGTYSSFYNNSAGEARFYGRITITDTGSDISVQFQGWDAANATAQVTQTDIFATTQPGVITCVATIGSISAGDTSKPSVVTCTASIGSATVNTGSTVTPAVVACPATIPTPHVGFSTAQPSVVPVAASIGTASVNTGELVTPSVVPAVASVGAAAPNTGETAKPTVVSVAAAIFTPTLGSGPAKPSVVSITATIGTASPSAGSTATPGVVSAHATIVVPATNVGSVVQAVMVACAAVIAQATVIAAQPYTPSPWKLGSVHIRWSLGSPHSSGYSLGETHQRWSLGSVHTG